MSERKAKATDPAKDFIASMKIERPNSIPVKVTKRQTLPQRLGRDGRPILSLANAPREAGGGESERTGASQGHRAPSSAALFGSHRSPRAREERRD